MTGPPAAVAAVRVAVRHCLADLSPGSLVLVACSGGPDSLALAAGLAFVGPRQYLRAGLLTVDHGWDPDAADRAAGVAIQGRALGLEPVEVLTAPAARTEGAARDARRAALFAAAARLAADAVLLGHTLDDQAETVLLRLARGSGARSLAGMPRRDGLVRRPLLDLRRETTRAACLDLGLSPWEDPTNTDPAFARARVRTRALPALEAELGPGIAAALARSADLLRADADALDADARAALAAATTGPAGARETSEETDPMGLAAPRGGEDAETSAARVLPGALAVDALSALPTAVRTRVLRLAALRAGCPPTALNATHVGALDTLITGWRGQGPVALPGGVTATRADGRITLGPGTRRDPAPGPVDKGTASATNATNATSTANAASTAETAGTSGGGGLADQGER